MNIISVTILAEPRCRICDDDIATQGDGESYEAAEKDLHEQLEVEGWTDGLCPDCAEKRFLDPADKADHDNKCQRELDP